MHVVSWRFLKTVMADDPAIHATTAITVIHPSCIEADIWATALCVLSPPKSRKLTDQQKLAVQLISRDGTELRSPALGSINAGWSHLPPRGRP